MDLVGAIVVAFIKSIINYFIKGSTVGVPIDQFIAFIASLSLCITIILFNEIIIVSKKIMFKRYSLISNSPLILSSIIMTLFITTLLILVD